MPIPDTFPETLIQAYVKEVYNENVSSRKILSGNITEFKNKLFQQVAKQLGIEYKVSSMPYHPTSNGRIDRFYSFLKAD